MADPDSEERPWLYFPERTSLATSSLNTFLRDCRDIFNLFMFAVQLAARADETRIGASKALIKGLDPASPEFAEYQKAIDNPDAVQKRLGRFSSLNARNLVTGTADSFLWYLSNIIQDCIKKRPELLRSSETIKIDDLMQFRTKSDLVEYLIDRKVNDLSYGGLRKMEQYFQERLGVDLFLDSNTRDMLNLFIEVRNIYVHNRGFVSTIFLQRVDNTCGLEPKLGERLHIDFDWYARFQGAAVTSAISVDSTLAMKFGLKRKRLSNWGRRKQDQRPSGST
ncbi:MAG: hypothetical protein M9924_13700 [Rhizobiaceae bacterium]|nr:hypothetical protein [Rhizobiaceae bacterium]